MSYKVAIVNGLDCHNECIGFLCETLLDNKYLKFQNIIINIYCNIDIFNYINYFKKIFPSINIYTTINSEEILKNDKIIKLTSNDPILFHENIISILHIIKYKDISKKYISLTPFLTNNEVIPFDINNYSNYMAENEINYIFPFYSGIYKKTYSPIITLIGHFESMYLNSDLDNFIRNSNFTFYFLSYNVNPNDFKKYNNVICMSYLSTEDLINIIGNSKFILARNDKFMNKDRFSGTLTLSISHRKPVILSEYQSNIYGIPSISYKENFCELTDRLNNFSEVEYNNELSKIDDFIIKMGDYNKQKLASLF